MLVCSIFLIVFLFAKLRNYFELFISYSVSIGNLYDSQRRQNRRTSFSDKNKEGKYMFMHGLFLRFYVQDDKNTYYFPLNIPFEPVLGC